MALVVVEFIIERLAIDEEALTMMPTVVEVGVMASTPENIQLEAPAPDSDPQAN